MKKLRIGVAGLGRAFAVTAPAFRDPRVTLVAGADPRSEARRQFTSDFRGAAYATVEELCADPAVEVVYVSTPHQFHAPHACLAASRGKHVLVEKPMALTLPDCQAMINAAARAGVQLVVGHSHSFDAPILQAKKLAGRFGRVRMIAALDYTDFLYRPRRPEELLTEKGGGAIYNQAAHQVDIVRLLAGAPVRSVRAFTGNWDAARPTEGAYGVILGFEGGAYATLSYSGYANFDSDEFMGGIGEMGQKKKPGFARISLKDELKVKNSRNYGGPQFKLAKPVAHQHFGLFVVSCDRADLRPTPTGVMVYSGWNQKLHRVTAPKTPRKEVIDELYAAVVNGKAPLHGGRWAMETLKVCLAMLDSARENREILL